MFIPVPTPSQMARWDARAIELGLPENVLMENAAREALAVLRKYYGPLRGAKVLLFMGGGNNGGDAVCLARHLHDAGALPYVLHTRPLRACTGAAKHYVTLARRLGVEFQPVAAPAKVQQSLNGMLAPGSAPDIVVDGLLGTGFSGLLRDKEATLVAHINDLAAHCFVLALDVPSGLNAGTGIPSPQAVRAQVTVTFQAPKPGLVLPHSAAYTGILEVRSIGVPQKVQEEQPAGFRLWRDAGADDFTDPYIINHGPGLTPGPQQPVRAQAGPAHKGEAGRVLIIGGSSGLAGAPRLAAWGALRGGAGLVSVAAPELVVPAVQSDLPDVITVALPGTSRLLAQGRQWPDHCPESLLDAVARSKALVVGPGMGRGTGAEDFLHALLALPGRPPAVLDADALFALHARPGLLGFLQPGDILTPHPGEAATLLEKATNDIQADRFAALEKLCALAPAVWVLKGAGTLVGAPDEPVGISPFDAPNLAVAGSGDVLAGLLGALLAQGACAGTTACLAVHLHALAGLSLAERFPRRGNSARDIADALPDVLALADPLSIPEASWSFFPGSGSLWPEDMSGVER